MTGGDLLGFDRYERHSQWRCSGRVDGDVDEIEPRAFMLERHTDRWLLTTGARELVVVGDARRDLVAADGGLERRPAGFGFGAYMSDSMLRQVGDFPTRDYICAQEVVEFHDSKRAGRSAVDVLLHTEHGDMELGIDAETGVWTWFSRQHQEGSAPPLGGAPRACLRHHRHRSGQRSGNKGWIRRGAGCIVGVTTRPPV